jgi:hypothetical protein
MTTTTDHPAEHCGYAWCEAHAMCDCAYADIHPGCV